MRTRNTLGMLVLGALALAAAAVLAMTLRPHDLLTAAQAQGGTVLALDMNADNGNGPCDPIDSSVSVGKGSEFKVAFCLKGAAAPPSAFDLMLDNDESLDQCVPVDCVDSACDDTNPDANAGATTWGTSLGTRWDCSSLGVAPPSCESSAYGKVYLGCFSTQEPTLPFGPDVAAPLGVVGFKAIVEGTDTFSLDQNSDAIELEGTPLVTCDKVTCPGGSVTITAAGAPTATIASTATAAEPTSAAATAAAAEPTAAAATVAAAAAAAATAVSQGTPIAAVSQAATAAAAASAATSAAVATKTAAGATSTPGGKATVQPTAAAGEGGGSSGPNAGVIAAIVVGAVVVVGGGGWFAWRRLRVG